MYARYVRTRAGDITIRPLRSGDTSVICSIFRRLGPESRRLRFAGPKTALTRNELELLATVDGRRHVIIAYADEEAIGVARLARDEDDRTVAEVAFAVADEWQGKGVGTALINALAEDARAAGIRRFRASILAENKASLALMKHVTTIEQTRYEGAEIEIVGRAA
jgi:RimJ/RimL family protein N-acetyltransferase